MAMCSWNLRRSWGYGVKVHLYCACQYRWAGLILIIPCDEGVVPHTLLSSNQSLYIMQFDFRVTGTPLMTPDGSPFALEEPEALWNYQKLQKKRHYNKWGCAPLLNEIFDKLAACKCHSVKKESMPYYHRWYKAIGPVTYKETVSSLQAFVHDLDQRSWLAMERPLVRRVDMLTVDGEMSISMTKASHLKEIEDSQELIQMINVLDWPNDSLFYFIFFSGIPQTCIFLRS